MQKGNELMSEDLFIPKLGQTVEEVVLIGWLVEDGTKVEFGDPVLEVETDKAIFNVEANAKGYIHFGPHQMGETLPVLTVVATIGKKDEEFSPSDQQAESEPKETSQETPKESAQTAAGVETHEAVVPEGSGTRDKIFASPRAKKLASEKGVDLSRVSPTGGEGTRVVEQDVREFLGQKPNATPIALQLAQEVGLDLETIVGSGAKGVISRSDVERAIRERLSGTSQVSQVTAPKANYAETEVTARQPLRSIRKLIFDRMAASDMQTARVTLVTEVDATELVTLRERLKAEKSESWGFAPGYNDLLAMIVAHSLKEFPFMNARVSEDGAAIEQLGSVNLGMAMDTDRGLVVPVIKSADQMDLQSLGLRFRELVNQVQSGKILPEDLTGGTFTMTNLGQFDVDAFTPVINLPEAGILGVGRIHDKAVAYQGEVKIRKMMTLSLVFDHRIIDGAPAARFLQRVKEYVEYPIMIFV